VNDSVIGEEDIVLSVELATTFEGLVLGFEARNSDHLDDPRGKICRKLWTLNQILICAARRSRRIGSDEAYP